MTRRPKTQTSSYVKIFSTFFLSIALSAISYVCYMYYHREFGFSDFTYRYPLSSQAFSTASEEEYKSLKQILSQKFTYLDKGKQMTAFESEDQQYVLKFFNPRPFLKEETFHEFKKFKTLFSMKWISYAFLHQKDRLQRLAKIYQEASVCLKEESALVFVSACKPSFPSQEMILSDKDGKEYTINISRYPFVLQQRVDVAQKHLIHLVKEGNIYQAKLCLESLADLFIARANKGFTDRIQTLHNNYGFLGTSAVQIDLGRLRKLDPKEGTVFQEISRVFSQLLTSVSELIPELETYTEDLLRKKLRQIQNENAL